MPTTVLDRAFASDDESSSCCGDVATYSEEEAEEEVESEEVEDVEGVVAGTEAKTGTETLSAKESRASCTAAKAKFAGTGSEWAASVQRKQELMKMLKKM